MHAMAATLLAAVRSATALSLCIAHLSTAELPPLLLALAPAPP